MVRAVVNRGALLASALQINICGRYRCRAVPAPRRVVSPGTYPCLPAAFGFFRGEVLIDGGRLERRYQLAIRFQLAYGYKAYLLLAHHH